MKRAFLKFAWLVLALPWLLNGQDEFNSSTNLSGVVGSGARAFGMGGAFIAVADDATAASWNPGGLGQLEKPELTLVLRGHSYMAQSPAWQSATTFIGPASSSFQSANIDFAAITFPFRLKSIKIVPQFSYQRGVNFNYEIPLVLRKLSSPLAFSGDNTYLFDFQGLHGFEKISRGGADYLGLSLASVIANRIYLGLALNYMTNGYQSRSRQYFEGTITPAGSVQQQPIAYEYSEMEKIDLRGMQLNAGILVRLSGKLKLGAVYKSANSIDVDNEIEVAFKNSPAAVDQMFSNKERLKLDWPATWGIGLAYLPIDTLTISIDFTTTRWSQAILSTIVGENLEGSLYFPTFIPVDNTGKSPQLDTRQWRLGLEYVLILENALVPLRFGLFSDSQYFTTQEREAISYSGVTAGIGIKKGKLSVDFAALYEFGGFLDSLDSLGFNRIDEFKGFLSLGFAF